MKYKILKTYDRGSEEYYKVTQEFINYIEDQYQEFIDRYKEKIEPAHKEIKEKYEENKAKSDSTVASKKFFIEPQDLLKKSPLAVLDAPWGSGKTFLIEKLIENLKIGENENKIFKNFIVIDAWSLFNSKSDINIILLKIIQYIYFSDEDIKKDENYKELKETLSKGYNLARKWVNPFLGLININLPESETEGKSKENKIKNVDIVEIASKVDLPHTLIFIDNIERLNENSWDVMKIIFKLTQLENLCFVLPMNLKRLLNNSDKVNALTSINSIENQISKYIDFPIIKLEQDFFSYLSSLDVGKLESEYLNELLKLFHPHINIRKLKTPFSANNAFWQLNYKEKQKKLIDLFEQYLEKKINTEFFINKIINKNNFYEIKFKKVLESLNKIKFFLRKLSHNYSYIPSTSNSYQINGQKQFVPNSLVFSCLNSNYKEEILNYKGELIEKINSFARGLQTPIPYKKPNLTIEDKETVNIIESINKERQEIFKLDAICANSFTNIDKLELINIVGGQQDIRAPELNISLSMIIKIFFKT